MLPEGIDIVKTIQVPRRFNDLTKNLPPSRYDTKLSPSDVAAAASRLKGERGPRGTPPPASARS